MDQPPPFTALPRAPVLVVVIVIVIGIVIVIVIGIVIVIVQCAWHKATGIPAHSL